MAAIHGIDLQRERVCPVCKRIMQSLLRAYQYGSSDVVACCVEHARTEGQRVDCERIAGGLPQVADVVISIQRAPKNAPVEVQVHMLKPRSDREVQVTNDGQISFWNQYKQQREQMTVGELFGQRMVMQSIGKRGRTVVHAVEAAQNDAKVESVAKYPKIWKDQATECYGLVFDNQDDETRDLFVAVYMVELYRLVGM